jgi:hypothetical protein
MQSTIDGSAISSCAARRCHLGFNEPRPARIGYEVSHLPGVLRAEPFRSVPVKLRFTHHQYRTALDGDYLPMASLGN